MSEFKIILKVFKQETAGKSTMERTAWLMYHLMFNPLQSINEELEKINDRLRIIENSVSE